MLDHPRHVAIGPRLPGHGSWDWIGEGLAQSLSSDFSVEVFSRTVPECHALILVKHRVPVEACRGVPCLYFPIDRYGSASEIDAEAEFLASCSHIFLHCRELQKYFLPYAPASYVDHPLNYVVEPQLEYRSSGPLLWVGVRSNLLPVIEWLNTHSLPEEVWLLTNLEENQKAVAPVGLGLNSRNRIRIENWSREKHLEWTSQCKAAFDVKGDDFRSRHKPAAKACDFIASGVPMAMNSNSSATLELQRQGFALANCDQIDHWLSREYWAQTQQMASVLRKTHATASIMSQIRTCLQQLPRFVDQQACLAPC